MPIQIRPYLATDWPQMARVHDAARKIELEYAQLSAAFLPFDIAAEREGLADYEGLDVAVMDGEVVGFCAYSEDELAWLYVSPAHMRQGIGRMLAQHAMQQSPGISTLEVLCGNEAAKGFYERLGFRVTELLKGKMPGNESFAVEVYVMEKQPQS